jgi:hypothetical protein
MLAKGRMVYLIVAVSLVLALVGAGYCDGH